MKLYGLLESITLLHHLLIFDTDHTIIHVNSHFILETAVLLLILKSSLTRSKWIHLIALAYLVTQSLHLILHELVVQVGSRSWILSYLFGDTLKEVTVDRRLIGTGRFWLENDLLSRVGVKEGTTLRVVATKVRTSIVSCYNIT